jgi:hypothetical protein
VELGEVRADLLDELLSVQHANRGRLDMNQKPALKVCLGFVFEDRPLDGEDELPCVCEKPDERIEWSKGLPHLIIGHDGTFCPGALDLIFGQIKKKRNKLRRRRWFAISEGCPKIASLVRWDCRWGGFPVDTGSLYLRTSQFLLK